MKIKPAAPTVFLPHCVTVFVIELLKVPNIPDFSFHFYPFSKIHSPTLQLTACPGKGPGNGTAAGHTRGGTIRRQERSSGITPASATAAGNSVTPSPPVPVDPPHPGRARRLPSSNRSAGLHACLTVSTNRPFWCCLLVCVYIVPTARWRYGESWPCNSALWIDHARSWSQAIATDAPHPSSSGHLQDRPPVTSPV